jgi:hypothetical protein
MLPVAPEVAVLSAPRRVAPGRVVRAVFRARPDSSCQIAIRYPDGRVERREVVVVDRLGLVSWRWVVPVTTKAGSLVADVVCSGGERGQAQIAVT